MNLLVKEFVERCKAEFGPLGFVRKGESFARVKNDVFQTFSLYRYRGNYSCTIGFDVAPLCGGELDPTEFSYETTFIEPIPNSGEWIYFCDEEESVLECTDKLIETIKKHIIPFFERAVDSSTALDECMKIENLLEENRKSQLETNGEEDCADPGRMDYIHYCDIGKYYMALKSKQYDFAIKYHESCIKRWQRLYKDRQRRSIEEFGSEEDKIKQLASYERSIKEQEKSLALLRAGDYTSFNKEIAQNEEQNIKALKRYMPKNK